MADFKPADANKDGRVTAAEKAKYQKDKAAAEKAAAKKPDPSKDQQDKLSAAQLESMFGFAKDVVWKNPDLRQLYQDAIRDQYTPEMFQSKLRGTKWYQNNAEYARKAWAAEKTGGADWQQQLDDAKANIQKQATAMGSRLTDEQIQSYARRYIFEGWGDPNRQQLMATALSGSLSSENGFMAGAAGNVQQDLAQLARRNGLTMNQSYYEGAAKSIASGLSTKEDFERDLRQQAATMWSPWSDKIMQGMDAEDLASGYINMLSQTMEVDPSSVSLHDPRLMKAIMTGDGKPMGLYDFQQSLRDDPAWMQTKQATDSMSSIGMQVLQKMGFQS